MLTFNNSILDISYSFTNSQRYSSTNFVSSFSNSMNRGNSFSYINTPTTNLYKFSKILSKEIELNNTTPDAEIDLKNVIDDYRNSVVDFNKVKGIFVSCDGKINVRRGATNGFTGFNLDTNIYLVTENIVLFLFDNSFDTSATNKMLKFETVGTGLRKVNLVVIGD